MNRAGSLGAAAVLFLVSGLPHAAARPLLSPLDEITRTVPVAAESDDPCPPSPPPLKDLEPAGYYADEAGSTPDASKQLLNRKIVKPLDSFTRIVLQQSDRFMKTGSPQAARCALDLLNNWAVGGALEGRLSIQGQFHRNWATNSFATAYLIVRPADLDRPKKSAVEDWLSRLCELDQQLAERVSNNHLLWCAASCATAGIASGRQQQLDWAIATAKQVLDEVTDQGVLPREIVRGARALTYHNFSLEALVVVAEMGLPNGEDLYGYRDGALRRLADFVIRNAADPAEAGELAGVPQSWTGATSGRFVWAEPYYRRFADPRLKDMLVSLRPLRHAYFGGNATLMYGTGPLP